MPKLCDDCELLAYSYERGVYAAHCIDPYKPALGSVRVVAVSRVRLPTTIQRPAWCRKNAK